VRRVEQIVQRHGELDHAEPGAEMAAGDGNRVDHLLPQLVGDLAQSALIQTAQIGGNLDLVQQRRLALRCHRNLSAYERRSTTNCAMSQSSSARAPNCDKRPAAWSANSPARLRAPSTPSSDTKVALPAARSRPTGLPVTASLLSISRRSSAIWNAR